MQRYFNYETAAVNGARVEGYINQSQDNGKLWIITLIMMIIVEVIVIITIIVAIIIISTITTLVQILVKSKNK